MKKFIFIICYIATLGQITAQETTSERAKKFIKRNYGCIATTVAGIGIAFLGINREAWYGQGTLQTSRDIASWSDRVGGYSRIEPSEVSGIKENLAKTTASLPYWQNRQTWSRLAIYGGLALTTLAFSYLLYKTYFIEEESKLEKTAN